MNFHNKADFIVLYIFALCVVLISCSRDTNKQGSKSYNKTQSEYITQQADSLFILGKSYSIDSMNQEKALELFQESFVRYEQLGNKHGMAMAYKRMGYAYDYLEDHAQEKEYLKKALKIFTKIDDNTEAAKTTNYLGISYTITGDIDSALHFYKQGLRLAKTVNNKDVLINIYQNMGICLRNAGCYEKAIESQIQALKYCEEIQYIEGVFDMNFNFANLYREIGELDKAITYCEKAGELESQIEDPYSLAAFHHTFGNLFFDKGNYTEAHKHFEKTLKISKDAKHRRGMAAAYSLLGAIALEEKDYIKATEYELLSFDIENEIDNAEGVISSLLALAEISYNKKLYGKALVHIDKADSLCIRKGLFDQLSDVYYHRYQTFKRSSQPKLALQFCENYYTLKDSLNGVEIKEKIADLEIKHQTEKKQQEIELLNEENNTKKQKIKARNRLLILLVLLVLVIVSIAYFFRQRGMQKLSQMESELQMYILRIKELHKDKASELEITSKEFAKKYDLTDRETDVLQLISEGISNADIAEKIFVSTNTVKYHIKNIYLKLDVKNRVEALNKISLS